MLLSGLLIGLESAGLHIVAVVLYGLLALCARTRSLSATSG